MDKVSNQESRVENYSGTSSFQCIDAIEISLFIEKEGLRFYEKAMKESSDPRLRDMFLKLAEEEKEHIQTLQTKIKFLETTISRYRKYSSQIVSFLTEELKGKVFPMSETKMAQKYKQDSEVLE